VLTALAVLAVSCTDRANPTGPTQGPKPGEPKGPTGEPITSLALECRADVKAKTVSCGDPDAGQDGGPSRIIIGDNTNALWVHLTSSNVDYDAGTGAFTFNVTVQNLLPNPQALGTTNAETLAPDPAGIRVFMFQDPAVTSGSGAITVVNHDGTDLFTAADQEFWRYSTVLQAYQTSAPKTWQFNMPATVTGFTFKVQVSAAVPYPNGYVEVQGNPNVRSGNDRTLTAILRDSLMQADPTPVVFSWTSGSPTTASIASPGPSALVHGLRAGTVTMSVATNEGVPRTGEFDMTVAPIRRTWTAAAATTDWHTGGNWSPDNIEPQPADTAVVPSAPSGGLLFPVLAANVTIGGLEVGDSPAQVNIGAFDLTATGDVTTGTLGGLVDGTVGRVILAGTARTVAGTFPRVRVTGTYSLTANMLLDNNLRVESGRLRTTGFRIRVNNP